MKLKIFSGDDSSTSKVEGWREKANLLTYVLRTGLANKHNYAEGYKKHLRTTRFDYVADRLLLSKGQSYSCGPGWKCIELWKKYDIPDNPECLR